MARDRLRERRSIRLRDFDYRAHRAYFVTLCAVQRLCLFGEIADGAVRLSDVGSVVAAEWQDLPNHRTGLLLDAWVVMPNHLHGILILPTGEWEGSVRSPTPRLPSGSLGAVIGGFKSGVSRAANATNLTLVRPLWQRNYYERVIRDDRELTATRRYIADNPVRWADDPDHPRHYPPPRP